MMTKIHPRTPEFRNEARSMVDKGTDNPLCSRSREPRGSQKGVPIRLLHNTNLLRGQEANLEEVVPTGRRKVFVTVGIRSWKKQEMCRSDRLSRPSPRQRLANQLWDMGKLLTLRVVRIGRRIYLKIRKSLLLGNNNLPKGGVKKVTMFQCRGYTLELSRVRGKLKNH